MSALRHSAVGAAAARATAAFESIAELLAESEDPQEVADTLHQLFLVPGPAHALARLVREAGLAVYRTQLPRRQALASQLLAASNALTLSALDVAELGQAVQPTENEFDRAQAATVGSPTFPATGAGPVVQGTGPHPQGPAAGAHQVTAPYSHR
ncbi:hypothetical protein ABH940_005575 [Streptacidiphilus sp. BW17]|uniref:hypothetical protein n=1 Tax=Streptacidiphilus sp. BW17 TaxID=3156274 RepID=UPI0035193E08